MLDARDVNLTLASQETVNAVSTGRGLQVDTAAAKMTGPPEAEGPREIRLGAKLAPRSGRSLAHDGLPTFRRSHSALSGRVHRAQARGHALAWLSWTLRPKGSARRLTYYNNRGRGSAKPTAGRTTRHGPG